MTNLTQHDKILKLMATDPERWWLPADFMKPELDDLFVGYEASARLSELAKLNKVESKRVGKYMARRLINRPVPKPVVAPRPTTVEAYTFEQVALIEVAALKPRKSI